VRLHEQIDEQNRPAGAVHQERPGIRRDRSAVESGPNNPASRAYKVEGATGVPPTRDARFIPALARRRFLRGC
jgi:hypothetical protein